MHDLSRASEETLVHLHAYILVLTLFLEDTPDIYAHRRRACVAAPVRQNLLRPLRYSDGVPRGQPFYPRRVQYGSQGRGKWK